MEQILTDRSYNLILESRISPSQQELFQLVSKISVTEYTTLWGSNVSPNNLGAIGYQNIY